MKVRGRLVKYYCPFCDNRDMYINLKGKLEDTAECGKCHEVSLVEKDLGMVEAEKL